MYPPMGAMAPMVPFGAMPMAAYPGLAPAGSTTGNEVVRSSSLTAQPLLMPQAQGQAQQMHPLTQTQKMIPTYMNGQQSMNMSFVPPPMPNQQPQLMGTYQGMPQAQQMHPLTQTQKMIPTYMNGQQSMNMSFVPPPMPNQQAALPQVPMPGASPDFKMGDRVQLKGHAANPNYEGKLYTVEAVDMSGTVMVSHKLGDRNVSRMTFHKAWLELVTPAEDIPPEPAPEVMEAPKPQVDPIESLHVGDTVRVVGLGPRHNGRMCSVEAVDMRRRILRVKFLESNDMLELGPTYLELVEKAREQPSIAPIRQGVQGEGGLRVGDTVRILAPPQHRGKVATVEVPNTGDGSLRVRLQDPFGQVDMLVLLPTHVQNMDGTPVAGTAEAVAASQAQVNAVRQAASMPPGGDAPLAIQRGDRVRVKASLQSQAGKVGIVEMEDDGAGCAVVQIQDSMGLARLRINPVHLDFA
ncbi:unnamed protein product [Durusdinium trenchii]